MTRSATIICAAAAILAAPIIASAQGIEAKLGNNTTATFVVKDSAGQEMLVVEANDQATESPNIKGGHNDNSVTPGAFGATIAGGGGWDAGLPKFNSVTDNFGTVGGGWGNQAGDSSETTSDRQSATVAGGSRNTASGSFASVGGGGLNSADGEGAMIGGGASNTAFGLYSVVAGGLTNGSSGDVAAIGGGTENAVNGYAATVPGGERNSAGGAHSFAAGRRAKADNPGCFVWGDSTDADLTCSTNNRWVARTTGGVDFYTNVGLTTGVTVAAGGSSWAAVSDRAVKENFTPIDKREVLEKVAALPVEQWNLKSQDPSIHHIGPMAQDFNGTFGYGEEERYINMMDATGVTMAAVQGLYEVVQDQKKEIEGQRNEIEARDHRIEQLEKRMEELSRLVILSKGEYNGPSSTSPSLNADH